MTALNASNAAYSLNSGKAVATDNVPILPWVRPADWLTLTAPSSSENKFVGLVAVWDADSNYVALRAQVSSGTYTVNWGDGTAAVTVASNTVAQYNYSYSSLSSSTYSTRGYRQAIVTVTPTTSGATFTEIGLNARHSSRVGSTTSNPWLDVAVSAPTCATVRMGGYDAAGTKTCQTNVLEQVTIVAHNQTNFSNMFREMYALRSVPAFSTSAITNMQDAFRNCVNLTYLPDSDFSSCTNFQTTFSDCVNLIRSPKMTLKSIGTANVSLFYAYQRCYSLKYVPFMNTSKVNNIQGMFLSCLSLEEVPLFDTSEATNMADTFSGCAMLKTVPLFNTVKVTSMNSMFASCRLLESVPTFNTAAVTDMNSMFFQCSALREVPPFNTAAVTNFTQFIREATSLRTLPLLTTSAATNISFMCFGANSLQTLPSFNFSNVTNANQAFRNCSSLYEIGTLTFGSTKATNCQQMFESSNMLIKIPTITNFGAANVNGMLSTVGLQLIDGMDLGQVTSASNNNLSVNGNITKAVFTNMRWTQSVANQALGAAQLDEMYTSLAVLNPSVTNVTATGTVVTYTVNDIRAFVSGRTVTITGVDPVAYNLTSVTVGTVTPTTGNAGTFTVTNAATGTYVSGGVATLQDNKTITVTGNPGTSGDTPSIATNKGWTVTGS